MESILAHILSHGFELEGLTHILITHSHLGHWGGAAELRDRTGAQMWAPAGAVSAMTNVEEERGIRINFKFGRHPSCFEPWTCPPDATFDDGDRVTVGNLELTMIVTQGHTKDSTCFLLHTEGKRSLFAGDTLFYGGKIGLVNLDGCSLVDYRRDIGKLARPRNRSALTWPRRLRAPGWSEAYQARHLQAQRFRVAGFLL